ncbi:MAG: hypothetical protein P1V36_11710 [Planctomycetota bacterium]|nr:hypothetical protein [Planctomycetota bacterium]
MTTDGPGDARLDFRESRGRGRLVLVGCLFLMGGCIPYSFPTQGALHHAVALESAPPERIEGHLAGLEREVEHLAFCKNEVPEVDAARLRRAVPTLLRYLDDPRLRVRVTATRILGDMRRIVGGYECAEVAPALMGDGSWVLAPDIVHATAAHKMPADVYTRLSLLAPCVAFPGVQDLAHKILAEPHLVGVSARDGEYMSDAELLRSLASDMMRWKPGMQSMPGMPW